VRANPKGVTFIELLIVMAVIGVITTVAIMQMPNDRFAVNQGVQTLTQAVQFARFEAIKQNSEVTLSMPNGAAAIQLIDSKGVLLRSYSLDPRGGSNVVIGSGSTSITFNARGISTIPQAISVSISHARSGYTRNSEITRQGTLRDKP
jgi:type IV fimbrial biogenesis protein FimT